MAAHERYTHNTNQHEGTQHMGTWNNTPTIGQLLPKGTANYRIIGAADRLNEHTGRRELALTLAHDLGTGEATIALEPWDVNDVAKFERVFKTQAVALGYEPSNGDADNAALVEEFASYANDLVGAVVNARVEHVESTTLRDDGTPFVNHRVYFQGVVQATRAPAVAGVL